MPRTLRRAAAFGLILILAGIFCLSFAEEGEPRYRSLIMDEAGLFDGNTAELEQVMEKITAYGHVAVLTTAHNSSSARTYAKNMLRELFGTDSSTVFLIDMDNREIYIYSDGAIYRYLNGTKANLITDNTYRYATRGQYTTCALESLNQMLTVLEGGKINRTMAFVSSGLMALLISAIATYYVAKSNSESMDEVAPVHDLLQGTYIQNSIINAKKTLLKSKKTKHVSSSSGGSGGGHSGGGGGGSSGGGGGHRF